MASFAIVAYSFFLIAQEQLGDFSKEGAKNK
jgi:hypothetical protein